MSAGSDEKSTVSPIWLRDGAGTEREIPRESMKISGVWASVGRASVDRGVPGEIKTATSAVSDQESAENTHEIHLGTLGE